MSNEADTCRRFVVRRLQAVGWDSEPDRLRDQGSGFRVRGSGPPAARLAVARFSAGSGGRGGESGPTVFSATGRT